MRRWIRLIPIVLAAAVYLPALWADFAWDDAIFVREQLPYFESIGDAFFPPDDIPEWGRSYYRPVVFLSFMADLRLFGDSAPGAIHAVNILMHVLATLFVWRLAARLLHGRSGSEIGAVTAALLFAVHPIHTESVSWISGRTDLLAAMLLLAALLASLRFRDGLSAWWLGVSILLYLLALLAKEVALSGLLLLPAVLVLAPAVNTDAPPRRARTRGLLLVAGFTAAIVLALGLRALAGIAYGEGMPLSAGAALGRVVRSGAYYVVRMLVPLPQSCFVSLEMTPGLVIASLVTAGALAALIAAAWWWRRSGDGVPLLGVLWFGLTIAPSLATAVRGMAESPVAERYLYLPSVGLCLLLGLAAASGVARPRWRSTTAAAVLLLAGTLAGATVARGVVWLDDLRLWTDTTRKAPDEGLPWLNLGQAWSRAGDDDRALESYARALDARYDAEGRAKVHSNRGMVFQSRRDLRQAEMEFNAAVREDPTYARPHYGLGMVHLTRAQDALKADLRSDTAAPEARVAIEAYSRVLDMDPRYVLARWGRAWSRLYLGTTMEVRGRPEEAREQYDLAREDLDAIDRQDPGFTPRGGTMAQARTMLADALRRISD